MAGPLQYSTHELRALVSPEDAAAAGDSALAPVSPPIGVGRWRTLLVANRGVCDD